MKTLRPQNIVLGEWTTELASHLGRSVDAISTDGLHCTDFSGDVEVRTGYGMTVRFALAFYLVRPESAEAVVFSEHSGYAEFDLEDDMVFAQITETIYRHSTDEMDA
jgi:hypothetical protein